MVDIDGTEVYDTCTGRTIADLEQCFKCQYQAMEECICSTDRGDQNLSYPICRKGNKK